MQMSFRLVSVRLIIFQLILYIIEDAEDISKQAITDYIEFTYFLSKTYANYNVDSNSKY